MLKEQKKVKKEINNHIFKYQKKDINEKLCGIFGENFRKYREDFNKTQNYTETKFVPDFPLTVALELTNRCNLNCIMCYKENHIKPKAELDLELLEKILKECKENKLPSIILGLGSETLMYRNIKEALELVRQAEIMDVFFGTNGVLLTEEIIEIIIKNKISRVEISMDAATEGTYNKVRRVPVLKKVEENLEKLIAAKKKYNSPLPVIRLCFVIMDINQHETQQFIDKWEDKVDYIDFQRFLDHSRIDNLLPSIDSNEIKNHFCAQPFYSLNVWADGGVSPCCSFYGTKLIFGNVHNQSLKEIWNSQKMKNIREENINKKENIICKNCLYNRDTKKIDSKFEEIN